MEILYLWNDKYSELVFRYVGFRVSVFYLNSFQLLSEEKDKKSIWNAISSEIKETRF